MAVLVSPLIGAMTSGQFDDWLTSAPTPIGFFDGQPIEITYVCETAPVPAVTPDDVERAIVAFLALTPADRLALSDLVLANCTDFLDAVEEDAADDALRAIRHPPDIWRFVQPTGIHVERRNRRDRDVYVAVNCECDWEQEHGLLLVFRQGRQVTRVSEQDGHLTEADAFDTPDADDTLLAAFKL